MKYYSAIKRTTDNNVGESPNYYAKWKKKDYIMRILFTGKVTKIQLKTE